MRQRRKAATNGAKQPNEAPPAISVNFFVGRPSVMRASLVDAPLVDGGLARRFQAEYDLE
jgi:hypothetical protein